MTYARFIEKLEGKGIEEKEANVGNRLFLETVLRRIPSRMTIKHWIITVTIGLAVFSIFGWGALQTGRIIGESEGRHQSNFVSYALQAEKEIHRTCAELDSVDQVGCIRRIIEATNEHQRAEQDLVAQTDMARWAFWMFVITIIMTVITALGVYWVWRTLLATQRMAEDTREIGEAQTTSYMVVSFTDIRPMETFIWVDFTIRNVGKTPANDVVAWIKIRPYNVSFPRSMNPFSQEKLIEFQTVDPEAERSGTVVFSPHLSDREFIAMAEKAGAKTFSAEIRVLWRDVFSRKFQGLFRMGSPAPAPASHFAEGEEYARRMLTSRSEFTKENGN